MDHINVGRLLCCYQAKSEKIKQVLFWSLFGCVRPPLRTNADDWTLVNSQDPQLFGSEAQMICFTNNCSMP